MECPNCGEEISEEDSVCPYCGCLITEPSYDAISDEMDEEEGSNQLYMHLTGSLIVCLRVNVCIGDQATFS